MPTPHRPLSQLAEAPFLTDGGLETTLVFREGLDIPMFAAFTVMGGCCGTDIRHLDAMARACGARGGRFSA